LEDVDTEDEDSNGNFTYNNPTGSDPYKEHKHTP